METGGVVEEAAGKAEYFVNRVITLAYKIAKAVVLAVVRNGRDVGRRVMRGQILDRAEVVGDWPEDAASASQRGYGFIGQQLIHRGRVPEIAVSEVGGGGAVELEDDLTLLVGIESFGGVVLIDGAVIVEGAADELVVGVVGVADLLDDEVLGVVDVGFEDGFGGGVTDHAKMNLEGARSIVACRRNSRDVEFAGVIQRGPRC